jgi:hypothetical protein
LIYQNEHVSKLAGSGEEADMSPNCRLRRVLFCKSRLEVNDLEEFREIWQPRPPGNLSCDSSSVTLAQIR